MTNDPQRANSVGLRTFARHYETVAIDALAAHRERLPEQWRLNAAVPFPIYYSFMHSVELALKAYMVHTGSVLDDLVGIGHDIEAALAVCHERGLDADSEHLTDTMIGNIKQASLYYRQKDFEYIRTGAVQLPHIDGIAEACAAILALMDGEPMKPPGR